ncbi:hypothetical protein PV08_12083 [Exophiala spinifera]|uniref:Uncharacterized protein n=1 Tax=Exophiala spinifera TaxID=91928 RepID=A0A0D2ASI0_9EURO|nr:uncharacterized protein PV08_12083 [Exophiala spinifera]KIW09668.1 hypothetical protein PV08_12083 [Exophiala spinifera]
MGNHQSNEVNPEILTSLRDLGSKLQNYDDTETKTLGDLVCNLTKAPSTLLEARPKLVKLFQAEYERQTTNSFEDVKAWLGTIKHNNQALSPHEIDLIAPMLRAWRLNEEQATSRLRDASQWIKDPSTFWGVTPQTSLKSNMDVVPHCLRYDEDYLRSDDTLLRLRRRVVREIICLSTTYEQVRVTGFTGGIKLVTEAIAAHKNIDTNKRNALYQEVKRCTTAGRRWLLLGHGVSLGIHKNVVDFERNPITEVEFDAAQQYCRQLDLFKGNILSTAWNAIVNWFLQSLYKEIVCDGVLLRLKCDLRRELRTNEETTEKETTAKNASGKQTTEKETASKKVSGKMTTEKETTEKETTAKKTARKKTAANKTARKKTAAKKTAGKKTAGKKTAGKKPTAIGTTIALSAHDESDNTGMFDNVSEIHHTQPSCHELIDRQPKRRRLNGVELVASGNSMDLNNFTQNAISETCSRRHQSSTGEGSPSDANSNAGNVTPEEQMDDAGAEDIEELRPLESSAFAGCEEQISGDYAGVRDELGSTAQELMADESCPGNDVPGMLMDFEHEYGGLDISLSRNNNPGSSNVCPGQFANNITGASINDTLPAQPVDFDPPSETSFMLPVETDYGTMMGFDFTPFADADTNFMHALDEADTWELGFPNYD